MKTRQNYLNGECSHREYYAQFVSEGVKNRVSQAIGDARIKASRDPHFNDIPLGEWDMVIGVFPANIANAMREAGDYPTLSGAVCIAKEAARQIKESLANVEG